MEAQETPVRPRRSPGGIWGTLTAIVGVLTLSLCGWYGLILVNPYSPLNPLPPATVTPYPGLVVTAPVDSGQPTPAESDAAPTPNPTAPGSAVATLTPDAQAIPVTATVGVGTPSATAAAPNPGATTTVPAEATATLEPNVEPTATVGGDGYPGEGAPPIDATTDPNYP